MLRYRFAEDGLAVFRQGGQVRKAAPDSLPLARPSVILNSPKYPHNVGQAIRIASCYGVPQVWMTGTRVDIVGGDGFRLPREERMRGYADVQLIQYEGALDAFIADGATPVAVEMRPNAERLPDFQHPPGAVYLFGPEDGSLPGSVLKRCHRFVVIPTMHCLNLASAVATVLYDRKAKGA